MFLKNRLGDFPGGPVVKSPPLGAGDVDLVLGQGTKIPRATEQLSPRASITELTSSRAHELQTKDST